MQLAANPLIDVCSVNDYVVATEVEMSKGDATTFYFQLVDREKNLSQHGYRPAGLRYIPADGATVTVTFVSIDASKQFDRVATNPFPGDRSIWAVSVLATDPLDGTKSLRIRLTESGTSRTVAMQAALLINAFPDT